MMDNHRIYDRDSADYRDLALDLIERAMEVNGVIHCDAHSNEPHDFPESYCEWIDQCNRKQAERAMEVNVPEYPDELPESYIEWIAMCNRRRMEEEKARAKELEWPTAEECAEYWRKKEL